MRHRVADVLLSNFRSDFSFESSLFMRGQIMKHLNTWPLFPPHTQSSCSATGTAFHVTSTCGGLGCSRYLPSPSSLSLVGAVSNYGVGQVCSASYIYTLKFPLALNVVVSSRAQDNIIKNKKMNIKNKHHRGSRTRLESFLSDGLVRLQNTYMWFALETDRDNLVQLYKCTLISGSLEITPRNESII